MRAFRAAVALTWIALLAHFAQVGHFLLVPHEVGPDGRLRHVHGPSEAADTCDAHRSAAPGDDAEPASEDDRPDGDIPDEPADLCPIAPPGLANVGAGEAPRPRVEPAPEPAQIAVPPPPSPAIDRLTIAPKHSPPARSLS